MLSLMNAIFIAALSSGSDGPPHCTHPPAVLEKARLIYPNPTMDVGNAHADVMLMIDATGALTDAVIYTSTGYDLFDAAALKAAHESTYAPATKNCEAVPSRGIFRADFYPDPHAVTTAMPQPHFNPGGDWIPAASISDDADLSAVGRIVGSWRRRDETLRIAEYVTDDIYLTGDKAIALVQARLDNVMQLTGENTRSAQLCEGKRSATELQFQFNVGATPKQSAVFVTVVDGTIYTIGYTAVGTGGFDPAALSFVNGFCG